MQAAAITVAKVIYCLLANMIGHINKSSTRRAVCADAGTDRPQLCGDLLELW